MKRGEVWWASLPAPTGSGPGYRQLVLVVQSNPFNESRIFTVIVAVVASDLSLAEAPGNVRLAKSDAGLQKPSVVNVSQLITLDRSSLTKKVKSVSSGVMGRVNDGLRLVLGI